MLKVAKAAALEWVKIAKMTDQAFKAESLHRLLDKGIAAFSNPDPKIYGVHGGAWEGSNPEFNL